MKTLLKYGIVSVLMFYCSFSYPANAVTYGSASESTNAAYTFDGAVANCQSKGAGWSLANAASQWDLLVAHGQFGWVNDIPSNVPSLKCWYESTWPENEKGAVLDPQSRCLGDIPKNIPYYGLCSGPTCSYAVSYRTWTACNASGLQYGSNPIYLTVKGSSCTDAPNWRTCTPPIAPAMSSVGYSCNAAGTLATISWNGNVATTRYAIRYDYGGNPWHPNSCTDRNPWDQCRTVPSTDPRFTTVNTFPGVSNTFWAHAGDALGFSAAQVVRFTCNPPAPAAPIVTLTAPIPPNPPELLANLNNNSATVTPRQIALTWTITNPNVCGTGCRCTITDGVDSITRLYADIDSRTYSPTLEQGIHNFSVTCTSSYSKTSLPANLTLTGTCTPFESAWGSCDKTCGSDAKQQKTRVDNNCNKTFPEQLCNMPDCPVSSEWKEVAN